MAAALLWKASDGRLPMMMRTQGDRRAKVRFEVFGSFWGMFDAGESVCVRNLTRQGALIEAHQPLAIESIQSVSLMLDGQPATADARVRHLEPLHHPNRYLVGVEFLSTSSAFCDAIDRVLAQRSSPTELR